MLFRCGDQFKWHDITRCYTHRIVKGFGYHYFTISSVNLAQSQCMNSLILNQIFGSLVSLSRRLLLLFIPFSQCCLFRIRNGIYPFSTLPWFVDLQNRKASNSNATPLARVKKTHVQKPVKETNLHFRRSIVHAMRVI